MLRFLQLRQSRECEASATDSAPSCEQPADLSHTSTEEEEEDSYDSDASLSGGDDVDDNEEEGEATPVLYQTHAFQQRVHSEHGQTKEGFATFMQRAVTMLPAVQKDNEPPVWWDFERDYGKTDGDDDDDEWEDLPISHQASVSAMDVSAMSSVSPRREHVDDVDAHDAAAESVDGFSQAHLLAQNAILKTRAVQELGERAPSNDCKELQAALEPKPVKLQFEPWIDDANVPRDPVSCFKDRLENNSFARDASPRNEIQTETMDIIQCFSNIQLVSPDYFETLRDATLTERMDVESHEKEQARVKAMKKVSQIDHYSSPKLVDLVHSMDLTFFEEDSSSVSSSMTSTLEKSFDSEVSSKPSTTIRNGGLPVVDYKLKKKPTFVDSIRKKFSSNFRSKFKTGAHITRVAYSLGRDSRKLTKEERKFAKSLLPPKPLLSPKVRREASSTVPRSSMSSAYGRPLSILLLNPILKIFEIVLVDIMNDTTVGDVLSKARAHATDEILGGQKYVSLCNRQQELAAPMLPVSLLIASGKHRKHGKLADQDEARFVDEMNRREMEARLLVAVPEGSTASDCQMIRRLLWQNPKVQRWWKQSDPFRHPDDVDDDVPEQVSCKPVKNELHRDSYRHVKYQNL